MTNRHIRNIFIMFVAFVLLYYAVWTSSDTRLKPVQSSVVPVVNDTIYVCNENFDDTRKYFSSVDSPPAPPTKSGEKSIHSMPMIYFVTPTYPRREQIAELTRLGQTLMHVPKIHWIVADDFEGCNSVLDYQLNKFGIPYTHLSSPMPDIYRNRSVKPRGVANRRAAINWIRINGHKKGILYFGDDDNTFDLKLFSEIRSTRRVSMFPVGLIGLYAVSTPIVKLGKVVGFFDSWPAKRMWPVDMAGFAVNLEYFSHHPTATMPYQPGFEEDEFLKSINLKMDDIEPKANNCTEILVWHTQTKKEKAPTIRFDIDILDSDETSLSGLLRDLEAMGVSHISSKAGIKAQVSINGKSKPVSSFFN